MCTLLEVTHESTDRKYTLYYSKETFGDSVNHTVEYIFSFIILFFLNSSELIKSRLTKIWWSFIEMFHYIETHMYFFRTAVKLKSNSVSNSVSNCK